MRADQMPMPCPPQEALLPCPFCGSGQDNAGEYPFPAGRNIGWIARCGNVEWCGAEIRMATEREVIAAWNRRAS